MNKYLKISSLLVFTFTALIAEAGNNDRAGQAGAGELLINPWARSSGWSSANVGSVRGLEAVFSNVAGLAFTPKTEVIFSRTAWLSGTDININSFGLAQRVGETGVLGISIMSMSFGSIDITTVNNPQGGVGSYSPSYSNLAVSYAKEFSHSIYGGVTIRGISESITDVSAEGLALDAGIQYVAGKYDNVKFGISLKNVGPPLSYSGEGLTDKTTRSGLGNTFTPSVSQKTQSLELPSLFNIGVTYDYKLAEMHRLTFAGTFTSNAFTYDEFTGGVEYGFRNIFMVRGGYTYRQKDVNNNLTNAYLGPTAGFTVEIPIGKGGKTFGLDYSYRLTDFFGGTQSLGAKLSL